MKVYAVTFKVHHQLPKLFLELTKAIGYAQKEMPNSFYLPYDKNWGWQLSAITKDCKFWRTVDGNVFIRETTLDQVLRV